MKSRLLELCTFFFVAFGTAAHASSSGQLADVSISATQDALRRGAETVVTLCSSCHALSFIRYRDLAGLGIRPETLEEWGSQGDLNAPIFSSASVDVSRDTFGIVPPDLSLIALARKGGARYIYTLLTAYHETTEGEIENSIFPGVAMPDVLGYSMAESGSEKAALAEQAKETAAFLEWAADPSGPFRRQLGFIVMGVLGVQTYLLYLWKKRVWRRLEKEASDAGSE